MPTMTAIANGYEIHSDAKSDYGRKDMHSRVFHAQDLPYDHRNANLPRSASYTFVPSLMHDPAYKNPRPVPITMKDSFSEDDLIARTDDSADASPPDSSGWTTPTDEIRIQTDSAQDLVAELHKSPKITLSRAAQVDDERMSAEPSTTAASSRPELDKRNTAPSGSDHIQRSTLAKRLSRRLSYSPSGPSRSPSPVHRESTAKLEKHEGAPTPPAPGSVGSGRTMSILRRRESSVELTEGKTSGVGGLLSRRGTLLRRKSTKALRDPVNARVSMDVAERTPAVPMIPKSFSTDKLPTISHINRHAPLPRLVSGEKIQSIGALTMPKKRDELWSVFRSLDADYTKFQSKSSALKANVIRSTLLPFLRNWADHPSNLTLRAEDLDRRANILNKWWTALLEMLHGRNNQSISGTDRPTVLDGVSGIMDRPEWRSSPSPLCPVSRRHMGTGTPRRKSSSSLASNGADFLAESVHHNVRNMFIQNLNSQMAFVVDRMSLRNASASLVTFCGKATAYAFFFCPGIAEVLVRLWDTPTDTLRRVLSENGVGKFEKLDETCAQIVSAFPPSLQPLGFCSLAKTLKHLRTQTPLPLGTANIQWYGFWSERWLGRESDLFYAFVKNFHILVTDYLPSNASKRERICVPGLLLVHSQILVNLDSTMHREASQAQGDPSASASTTFDDVLADPDAVASTLPLPPVNAIRVMAENRLIMLVRDFLSERSTEHPTARQLFAESFTGLLQACARGISIYNHGACYTLCDFLEEALLILVRYEHANSASGSLVDSHFWQDVCRKMIGSQNTMTEIRLCAFLYTVWNTVTSDSERKADLCLGLLLEEKVFERTFCHWCPMVRAYYMRLLCWRVGRFDGEASSGDRVIFETLLDRLRSVWGHYLWLKEDATNRRTLLPSTVPCNPAPGRRLLVVRTDTQLPPPGGSFLAFDGLVQDSAAALPSPSGAWKRHSTLSPVLELDTRSISSASSEVNTEVERDSGIRGFLRSMMGTSKNGPKSQQNSRPSSRASTTPPGSATPSPPNGRARAATDDSIVRRGSILKTPVASPVVSRSTSPARHRNFSFKFSLEAYQKPRQFGPMRLCPPKLPMPAQMFLQSHSAELNSALNSSRTVQPIGDALASSKYAGRALAEWMCVVMECQSFFERRKGEGVPSNKHVETPTLGVEVFSRRAV